MGTPALTAARSWDPSMVTKGDEKTEAERIREMIRMLHHALDNCNKLLALAEETTQLSGQDNEPPLKHPSA